MKKIKGNDKKNVMTIFRLSQRLMRGCRGQLYFLLLAVFLFQVEASLMMPLILKSGFQAVADKDMEALLRTAVGGTGVFAFNFIVMYFINVYGDAWVTKFAFHAAENGFKELSKLPVASIQAVYKDDDMFNRIAAGTGNIMGFYFSMSNLLGNGVAVIALTAILYRFSNMLGGILLVFIVVELGIVWLQFLCNDSYTRKLQKDKEESIRRVRSLLEQLSFHQYNQTWEWMQELYGSARKTWFRTQEKKTLTGALLGSCQTGIQGLFKVGLVYSFMVKKEIFSSYAESIAASFSAFNNLVDKTKEFGRTVSALPNSFVPISKMDDVLAQKPLYDRRKSTGNIVLEHISVTIGDKEIIRDVCCQISPGSKVAIIGENGSGKSTLLKVIAGLHQYQNGHVYDLGQRIAYMPAEELLFQGHSVLENISYSRENIPVEMIKRQLGELRFYDVEELCGKTPVQLSGGEAKRINIARGLLGEAEVILADEPDSCLDKENAAYVMRMLLTTEKRTVIFTTHTPEHARLADMVIFMQDGEVRQVISKGEYEKNAYFCAWCNNGKTI